MARPALALVPCPLLTVLFESLSPSLALSSNQIAKNSPTKIYIPSHCTWALMQCMSLHKFKKEETHFCTAQAVRRAGMRIAPPGATVSAVPFARLHVSMSRTVPLRLPMLDPVASKVRRTERCVLNSLITLAFSHFSCEEARLSAMASFCRVLTHSTYAHSLNPLA